MNGTRTVKVLGLGDEQGWRPTLRIHGAHAFGRQIHVKQPVRNAWRARTRQLRRNTADEAMVRVAGAAIRSPRDHGIRAEPLQLSGDAIGQPVEQRAIADVVPSLPSGKPRRIGG